MFLRKARAVLASVLLLLSPQIDRAYGQDAVLEELANRFPTVRLFASAGDLCDLEFITLSPRVHTQGVNGASVVSLGARVAITATLDWQLPVSVRDSVSAFLSRRCSTITLTPASVRRVKLAISDGASVLWSQSYAFWPTDAALGITTAHDRVGSLRTSLLIERETSETISVDAWNDWRAVHSALLVAAAGKEFLSEQDVRIALAQFASAHNLSKSASGALFQSAMRLLLEPQLAPRGQADPELVFAIEQTLNEARIRSSTQHNTTIRKVELLLLHAPLKLVAQ